MQDELREPRPSREGGVGGSLDLAPPVLRLSHAERLEEERRERLAEEKRKKKRDEEIQFQKLIKRFQNAIDQFKIRKKKDLIRIAPGEDAEVEKALPFLKFDETVPLTSRQERVISRIQPYIANSGNAIKTIDQLLSRLTEESTVYLDDQIISKEEILAIVPYLKFPQPRFGGVGSFAMTPLVASPSMYVGTSAAWLPSYTPTKVQGDIYYDASTMQTMIVGKDGEAIPVSTDLEEKTAETNENVTKARVNRVKEQLSNGMISRETAMETINALTGGGIVPPQDRRSQVYVVLQKLIIKESLGTLGGFLGRREGEMPDGSRITWDEVKDISPYLRYYVEPGLYTMAERTDPTLPLLVIGDIIKDYRVLDPLDAENRETEATIVNVVARMGNIADNVKTLFRQTYQGEILYYARGVKNIPDLARDTPMAIDVGWQGTDIIGVNDMTWVPRPGVNIMPDRFFNLLVQSKGYRANAVTDALAELNARNTRGIRTDFQMLPKKGK
jgi:hypothetical protein